MAFTLKDFVYPPCIQFHNSEELAMPQHSLIWNSSKCYKDFVHTRMQAMYVRQ